MGSTESPESGGSLTDVERLYEEYLARLTAGEQLSLSQFADEHHEQRESLLHVARIHDMLNQAREATLSSVSE